VQQGSIIYCAFEGQSGFEARVEAFRQQYDVKDAPFFLEPVTIDLVGSHKALIAVIRRQLGRTRPVAVVLDTLNRSLRGSESSDEDMGAYLKAADAIREAFDCAVIIVHHCGIDGTRPRGHTSLTGAADAQLSVKRDADKKIVVTVECAKDGAEGEIITSELVSATLSVDEEGDLITSCVVKPATGAQQIRQRRRLSADETLVLRAVEEALAENSEDMPDNGTYPAGKGVKRSFVRDKAFSLGLGDPERANDQRSRLSRSLTGLDTKNYLKRYGEMVWLTP